MIGKALLTIVALTSVAAGAAQSSQSLPIEWSIGPAGSDSAFDKVHLALSYRTLRSKSNNSRVYPLSELQGLAAAQLASQGRAPATFRIAREAGAIDCNGFVERGRGAGTCQFTPEHSYATALERRGLGRPTLQQQYQLLIQDVGLSLLAELDRQGYGAQTIDKLIAAGIHGVSVPYLRSLDAAGYRTGAIDHLINFRIHGVDAELIKGFSSFSPGSTPISADQLVAMRIHGIAASTLRQLKELGYSGTTADDLIEMAIHGATPAFISQMARAGYRGLTPRQLIAMRIHGVTPDFVEHFVVRGSALPTADQLVRMRISGVRPAANHKPN